MAKGTLKCCAIVRNMVVQADFYEEEDFVPQPFGFGMCELTPEPEILAELLRVEQRLTARIKWLKMSEEEREAAAESAEAARLARLEKIRAAAEEAAAEAGGEDLPRRRADDLEDPGDGSTEALLCAEGEDEIALAEALRARVTYRRGYLNGLFQLHSKGAKAATFAHKSFKFAQTQLAALAKHVGLGTAAQSKSEDPSIGFNADCNRRLLGPAPPRAMEEMSIEQGIAAAESLFGDMCGKTTRIFRLACFQPTGTQNDRVVGAQVADARGREPAHDDIDGVFLRAVLGQLAQRGAVVDPHGDLLLQQPRHRAGQGHPRLHPAAGR